MGGMYEDLKGPEIPSVLSESSIILLPVGAIEQHGPHLPMSVDRVIAEETAKAIVAKCGDDLDIWLLPTISVSKSNEHNWSEGTISLRYETLMAVLHDIGESLSKTNAKKLAVCHHSPYRNDKEMMILERDYAKKNLFLAREGQIIKI